MPLTRKTDLTKGNYFRLIGAHQTIDFSFVNAYNIQKIVY